MGIPIVQRRDLRKFAGDCQKVNCSEGAREAPLGAPECALVHNDIKSKKAKTKNWRKIK